MRGFSGWGSGRMGGHSEAIVHSHLDGLSRYLTLGLQRECDSRRIAIPIN